MSGIDRNSLPYRRCVGIMLFNRDGLVWVGRRLPKWEKDVSGLLWQMPQGGIDDGETPREAALRELEEEIGTANVTVVGETESWLSYDLPDEALGIALEGRYRGQQQKWFAMRFKGEDSEIDIAHPVGGQQEFDAWKWVEIERLPRMIVAFKRPVYEQVVAAFRHLARRDPVETE